MERRALLFASVLLMAAGSSLADDMPKVVLYGHLRGRFVYDGEPPKPKRLKISGSDKDELEKLMLVDESLMVNPDNRGLANVVVYLQVSKDEVLPEMHPSYRIAPDVPEAERMKTLHSVDTRFVPHVLLLRTDEVLHTKGDKKRSYNAKIEFPSDPPFGRIVPPSDETTYRPRGPERSPAPISDSIYPWMRAWILIQDHPYMAVTDADGRFEIRNIPVGRRSFRFWHEKSGYISTVSIDDRQFAWDKGKGFKTLEIFPSETSDLGEMRIAPALFESQR